MLDTSDILIALDIYCEHDWMKVYNMLLNKDIDFLDDEGTMLKVESELYAIIANGYKFLAINDEDYPKEILNSIKPPFVIYYKGDLVTISKRYSFSSSADRMFIE